MCSFAVAYHPLGLRGTSITTNFELSSFKVRGVTKCKDGQHDKITTASGKGRFPLPEFTARVHGPS